MNTLTLRTLTTDYTLFLDISDLREEGDDFRREVTKTALTAVRNRVASRQRVTRLDPGGYYHGLFSMTAGASLFTVLYMVSRTPREYQMHVTIAHPMSDVLLNALDEL